LSTGGCESEQRGVIPKNEDRILCSGDFFVNQKCGVKFVRSISRKKQPTPLRIGCDREVLKFLVIVFNNQ
jgi:hypothetical protein